MAETLLVANWKMNGSKELVQDMQTSLFGININSIDIVICPPFPFISLLASNNLPQSVAIGAQNCFAGVEDQGAFTGEISAKILKDLGCKYIIVGHSERRTLLNETSNMVKTKAGAILSAGITPIICYGETSDIRTQGNIHHFLKEQLNDSIPDTIPSNIVLAYEPIWAIGSGKTPTIEEISEVGQMTRDFIKNKYGESLLQKVKILYGGSVSVENIHMIVKNGDMDGVLVGGASLNPQVFINLIKNLQL